MKRLSIPLLIALSCSALFFAACRSHPVTTRTTLPEKREVKVGMTDREVITILGTHWKKCNHSMAGHYTLVYDDVAVRIRHGRVYEIGSGSDWTEIMKNVPYGGEYP